MARDVHEDIDYPADSIILTPSMGRSFKGNVVLIPGLGAPILLMKPLGFRLKRAGYVPVYMRYPLHTPLEHHVETLKGVLRGLDPYTPLFIVTHSYGAMICRSTFADPTLPRPKRVVMVAPVNQGSDLARKWYELTGKFRTGRRLMALFAGPVPFQILPENVDEYTKFPLCSAEVGVISLLLPRPISRLHPLLDGPNDGTTLVQETYIPGMKDFIVLTGEHNSALLQGGVAKKIIRFLDRGDFRD
jgi:alpha-beta hydrolase superfamily lysophospholipase